MPHGQERLRPVSVEDIRWQFSRRLSRLHGLIRVGAVTATTRDTIMAEIRDSSGAIVLYVEVDRNTGDTLGYL